jgi:hypothetical protein
MLLLARATLGLHVLPPRRRISLSGLAGEVQPAIRFKCVLRGVFGLPARECPSAGMACSALSLLHC